MRFAETAHDSVPVMARVRARGRFLFAGEEKFFLRGATYGPFPENKNGEPLPEPEAVARDFELMRAAGVNTVRVYYVPPRWFLDLAQAHGVYVMAGIPWPQHLCFLDQWEVREEIKRTVREAARLHQGHPAILAWLVGNEIPTHIVRWHGAGKVERFLEKLCAIVREEDSGVMVSYANYPSTEYLRLPFLDFLSFNLYLHDEKSFSAYVKRLQNVAGDLPLVLSELGMDSMRHGDEAQAAFLSWQLARAFELGVSGAVAFAWTDEWFTGGNLIEDWAFGMVTADRTPKLAYEAVSRVFNAPLPPLPENPPFISVVVCAYNADSTMEGCMASLARVDYPRFEVIVVDDGSTDATGRIADDYAARHPFIKVIHQPNMGLSAARNAGLHASAGGDADIVAYTDSDCYVDEHWLRYMALAMADGRFAAVGGPNLPPPEDSLTAACVAVSPGAPTHVLVTDEVAEHIPGCNMAYRKDRLLEIGGFDALYRAAGDDVDVCWRLQDLGYVIGFSAAMFVWHHRRNTVKAYLKQQKGYGRAEALLMPKHAFRFNALGNSRWAGRIYGDISGVLLAQRPVIYHGAFGLGLFQTLYEPKGSLAAYLPLSMEWMAAALFLLLCGLLTPVLGFAGLAMAATSIVFAAHRASKARLPKHHDTLKARALIVALTLSQPVLRGLTRYRTLWDLRRKGRWVASEPPQYYGTVHAVDAIPRVSRFKRIGEFIGMFAHRLTFHRFFWNQEGLEREALVAQAMKALDRMGRRYATDAGFAASSSHAPWDLKIASGPGMTCSVRLTVENHGGNKRFVRLAGMVLPTATTAAGLGLTLAGALALLPVSAVASAAVLCATGVLALRAFYGVYRSVSLVSVLTQYLMLLGAAQADTPSSPLSPGAAGRNGQHDECASGPASA
mgnify:CR=1 FL=1